MAGIKHYLLIKSSPEKVYTALTTTKGLKEWWTSEAKAEEFVGGIAEFIFGEQYHNKMKVTYLEPNKKIEWEGQRLFLILKKKKTTQYLDSHTATGKKKQIFSLPVIITGDII